MWCIAEQDANGNKIGRTIDVTNRVLRITGAALPVNNAPQRAAAQRISEETFGLLFNKETGQETQLGCVWYRSGTVAFTPWASN